MKEIKRFFQKLIRANWLPEIYFDFKDKYGDNFEIDGYTHNGQVIRNIRIKFFDEYFDIIITDKFEFIGKIEMKERIEKALKELNK